MLELHHILGLRSDASKETIKSKYHTLLYTLHPTNKHTGNHQAFIELQEAYRRYLSGDSHSECFAVIGNENRELDCRCGGKYKIEENWTGMIECEFCSCFIEVQEAIQCLK